MAEKGIQFKGNVFLRRYNPDGTLPDTVIGPIAGTKLSIKADADVKTRKSKKIANFGQIEGTTSISKPTQIGLAVNAVDPALLAMLFMGTSAALSIASGTVTGESKALPHDEWVKLNFRHVSAVVITGKTLGTDYVVNPHIGLIKALPGGTIVDGAVTSIAYAHGPISGTRIAGGAASKIDVELMFEGVNVEDSSDVYVEVAKMTMTPKTDINLLADDYVTAEFDGMAIKLDGQPEFVFDDDVVYS